MLYLDFAWVYYSRQRVKLRHGAIVDGDDFDRGWLVGKILGRAAGPPPAADAEGGAAPADATNGGWGRRGISVSADEEPPTPSGQDRDIKKPNGVKAARDPGARPEESARILHDSDDDDASEIDEPPPNRGAAPGGVGNGAEWRDGARA